MGRVAARQGQCEEGLRFSHKALTNATAQRQLLTHRPHHPQTSSTQPIIKALLDVADNLQRAAEAVPSGVLDGSEQLEAERAQRLLKSLLEGVQMTEGVLMKVG